MSSYEDKLYKQVRDVFKRKGDKEALSLAKKNPRKATQKLKTKKVIDEDNLDVVTAIHTSKLSELRLHKPFSIGSHVRLMKVKGENLVVKWYTSGERKTFYEIEVYLKLKEKGCPLPYFSCNYEFWGEPVLVMEKLLPLKRKEEDIFLMGIHVLEQLEYLHSFAIHCDIKPENVMKKMDNNGIYYFLIDYGGVALEPLKYGYKRWIWSKYWTSQEPHVKKQVVTARHDFKELCYTMNYLSGNQVSNYRKDFTGRLKDFMSRVKRVDKTNVRSKDYKELIKILS